MVGYLGNALGEFKHRVYKPVRLFTGIVTHFLLFGKWRSWLSTIQQPTL